MEIKSYVKIESPKCIIDGQFLMSVVIIMYDERHSCKIFRIVPNEAESPDDVKIEVVYV